jgi:two-component system response regulator NreC
MSTASKNRFSVLHVDDDALWRSAVAGVLRSLPELARIESVATAQAARACCAMLRPRVILVDVVLPDSDGLELARELREAPEHPRVVLLSVRRDDAVLHAAACGAIEGVLWKTGEVLRELPTAIRAVVNRGSYHPAEVRAALRQFRADPRAYFKLLSKREMELVPLFGAGLADEDVAAQVSLSIHTVRAHRRNVMAKLDLHSTPRLIHWAIHRGIVRTPSSGWIARQDEGGTPDAPT